MTPPRQRKTNFARQSLCAAVICLSPALASGQALQTGAENDPLAPETAQSAALLPAQTPENSDPFSLLALGLAGVFDSFGTPQAVYALRGEHPWQDDVVLQYKNVDFYIYKDQVWQVGVKKIMGVSLGDPEKVIELVFKDSAQIKKDYITVLFNDRPWPAELRFNINKNKKVSAIYLYRVNY